MKTFQKQIKGRIFKQGDWVKSSNILSDWRGRIDYFQGDRVYYDVLFQFNQFKEPSDELCQYLKIHKRMTRISALFYHFERREK